MLAALVVPIAEHVEVECDNGEYDEGQTTGRTKRSVVLVF